ncbi:MAG: cysteine--tRNA ligase [Pseudomonadota bacterium]|nr:cysteine--tRNA ligase [Gammaproteobacteria bacterium]MEE2684111.1 cysteine--tRNA ligase [Pseudomonadota bacterium]
MSLYIHNTLTGSRELFEPITPGKVRMYVCGPTVYNFAHIGNARPAVVFDVLARLLRTSYDLRYVRNVTDVDDKINAAAKSQNIEISELTLKYLDAYHNDMAKLGVLEPDLEPKVTEHIDDIILFIKKLIQKGYAYEAESHVIFDVSSFHDYGILSGRNKDQLLAGARVEVAPYKKDPADFILWKPSKSEEVGWDSNWGRGRPGWHIECSVMAEAHLGEIIDIHGGGQDLIFPHHENELAQSSCTLKHKSHCRYWMHNGLVSFDKEKMSKSIGNILLVNDLLKEFPGEVIRLALLSSHYRQPLDWNSNILDDSQKKLDKLYGALRSAGIKEKHVKSEKALPDSILGALNDDLNTPLALAELFSMAKDLNLEKNEENRFKKAAKLRAGAELLGLLSNNPEKWFTSSKESTEINHQEIEILLKKRDKMRKDGFYAEADQIRIKLEKHNIIIEDSQQGAKWRRKR